MTDNIRFTKANLATHLWDQADRLAQRFGFTDSTGTAQLRSSPSDNPQELAVAYGQWITLRDMALDLEAGLNIQDWKSHG